MSVCSATLARVHLSVNVPDLSESNKRGQRAAVKGRDCDLQQRQTRTLSPLLFPCFPCSVALALVEVYLYSTVLSLLNQ